MKKICLSLIALSCAMNFSYAQTNTFTSSGNVGIGTTSPNSKLDVQGGNATVYNTGGPTNLAIGSEILGKTSISLSTSTDAGGYGIMQTISTFGNAYGNTIINPNGGNVGIGTPDPAYNLDVAGSVRIGKSVDGTSLMLTGKVGTSYSYTFDSGTGNYLRVISGAPGATPFILDYAGNVGIGTTTPDAPLAVNGMIHAREVKVDLTSWPDYVFKANYSLPVLTDVKTYIDQNHHLSDMPSEQ
jgi:hypothetical protein